MNVKKNSLTDNVLQAIADQNIQNYLLNTCTEKTQELFFVGKNCTLRRNKQTEKCDVTIFHDFEEDGKRYRGSSSFIADVNLSLQELCQKISDAYRCAEFVKNPYYKLPASESAFIPPEPSCKTDPGSDPLPKYTADTIAQVILSDTNAADNAALINSLEVFVTEKSTRIINSNGINVHYHETLYSGEYIVQAIEPQDVELYYDFSYTDTDDIPALLKNKVQKSLCAIKDRAKAVPVDTLIPSCHQSTPYKNIILEGACVYDLFYYYLRRLDASMIYPKYSNYRLGDSIVRHVNKENAASAIHMTSAGNFDTISMEVVPKTPYSAEGIRMTRRCLINKNEVRLITGNARFSSYLGLPATGMYDSYQLACGKTSIQDMQKEPYLKIVHFSDFQMDELTGQFGGEYRLAYYFDGEQTYAVTNGSFSGNINDCIDRLTLSCERQSFYHFDGPLAVAFENCFCIRT